MSFKLKFHPQADPPPPLKSRYDVMFRKFAHRDPHRRHSERCVARLENGMLDAKPRNPLDLSLYNKNAANSPLLRLPPEIRNRIYMYVFRVFFVNIAEHQPEGRRQMSDKAPVRFLEACRQIYIEARMLPFAFNEFQFDHRTIEFWIEKMPAQIQAITTFRMAWRNLDGQVETIGFKRV